MQISLYKAVDRGMQEQQSVFSAHICSSGSMMWSQPLAADYMRRLYQRNSGKVRCFGQSSGAYAGSGALPYDMRLSSAAQPAAVPSHVFRTLSAGVLSTLSCPEHPPTSWDAFAPAGSRRSRDRSITPQQQLTASERT